MQLIKVGAAALNQTPLDWKGNTSRIIEAIKEAKNQNVTLLCLPELCITGYGCEDHFLSIDVQRLSLERVHEIAKVTQGITVCVGLPLAYNNALYNVTAVIQGGKILGFVAKQHLANDGLHYESRWFKPWPAGERRRLYPDWEILIGDLQFDFNGVRVGFEICEDAFVANRPGARLAQMGADIILNPSASHFAFGKQQMRERLVVEGSRAFNVTYVYANLLGNEAGRTIYGGECLIATGGQLVAQSKPFSYKPFEIATAVIDVDVTRTRQISSASFSSDWGPSPWISRSVYWGIGKDLRSLISQIEVVVSPPITTSKVYDNFEAFSRVLPLALYDYMRKSGSKGYVISLSGGADSAVCALLVYLMKRHAEEVGVVLPPMSSLLTCVYQSTRNSSTTTSIAAKAVATNIQCRFLDIDVDAITQSYIGLIEEATNEKLDWETHDIPLQNVQARVRAPGAWLLANLEGKLLITTSNRSESAVGYCTMDGDTAGCLAPINGVDKDFILKWLAYVKEDFRSVELILEQRPTAELRPGSTQTDEDDLMPYALLERIETLAILEKKSPKEVYRILVGEGGTPLPALYGYICKFFSRWCRNQWKRERYALGFHVDDRNLDPRSWCRFPVLSGGFESELQELDLYRLNYEVQHHVSSCKSPQE